MAEQLPKLELGNEPIELLDGLSEEDIKNFSVKSTSGIDKESTRSLQSKSADASVLSDDGDVHKILRSVSNASSQLQDFVLERPWEKGLDSYVKSFNSLSMEEQDYVQDYTLNEEKVNNLLEIESIVRNKLNETVSQGDKVTSDKYIKTYKNIKDTLEDIDSTEAFVVSKDVKAAKLYDKAKKILTLNDIKFNETLIKRLTGKDTLPKSIEVEAKYSPTETAYFGAYGGGEELPKESSIPKEKYLTQMITKVAKEEPERFYNEVKRYFKNEYNEDVDIKDIKMIVDKLNTDEGIISQYPFVNALIMGVTGGNSTTARTALGTLKQQAAKLVTKRGLTRFFVGAGMETPTLKIFDETQDIENPMLRTGAGIGVLLAGGATEEILSGTLTKLGSRAKTLVSGINAKKVLRNTERKTGESLINELENAKDFNKISNLKDVDEVTKTAVHTEFDIPKDWKEAPVEFSMPVFDYHKDLATGKITKANDPIAFKLTEGNHELAKTLEELHNYQTSKIANAKNMEQQYFSGITRKLYKAIDDGDLDTALNLLSAKTREAERRSYNYITNVTIPDADTTVNFFRRMVGKRFAYGLPGEAKESMRYVPEAVNQMTKSLTRSHDAILNSIFKKLSKSETKLLDDTMKIADIEQTAPELTNLPKNVRKAYGQLRKYYKSTWQTNNEILEKQLSRDGIMDLNGRYVEVDFTPKDSGYKLTYIDDGTTTTVKNLSELKTIKEPITWKEFYFHRVYDGDTAISIVKSDGTVKRVFQGTLDEAIQKEVQILKDLPTKTKDKIIRHKATVDAKTEYNNYNFMNRIDLDSLDLKAKAEIDEAVEVLEDLGLSELDSNKFIKDTLVGVLGKDKVNRLSKHLTPRKLRGRSAEVPIGQLMDIKKSTKQYAFISADMATTKNVTDTLGRQLLDKYGKYLENPRDPLSKVKTIPNDTGNNLKKTIEAYQQQYKYIARIPNETQMKFENFLYDLADSKMSQDSPIGKILSKSNPIVAHFPNFSKKAGYTMKLGGALVQMPLQASFAMLGLASHPMLLMTKPHKFLQRAGEGIGYLSLIKSGLRNNVLDEVSEDTRLFIDNIIDNGWMDDLLGTESTRTPFDAMMKFTTGGEAVNRYTNIIIASEKAKSLGYKIGTPEYDEFVSSYFPKYSQSMSRMFNTPLTESPITKWNIGEFKKFAVNFTEQLFSSETTKPQKLAIMAAFYGAYGKEGIPGVSELSWGADKLMETMLLANMADNMGDTTLKDIINHIDRMPELTSEERVKYKNKVKQEWKTYKEQMSNFDETKLERYLNGEVSLSEGMYNAILDTIRGAWNYRGPVPELTNRLVWNNMLENLENYGVRGLLGSFPNSILGSGLPDTVGDLVFRTGNTKEAMDRLRRGTTQAFKSTFTPLHKTTSGVLDVVNLWGLIDDKELKDKDGNIITWDMIFDRPFELEAIYPQYSMSLRTGDTYKTSNTIEIGDILYKLAGTTPLDKQERMRAVFEAKDLIDRYKKANKAVASDIVYAIRNGNLDKANALESDYLSAIFEAHDSDGLSEGVFKDYIRQKNRIRDSYEYGFQPSAYSEKTKEMIDMPEE